MSTGKLDGFFYGLFMDPAVLAEQGILPENPRAGFVDGFQLHIGARATLMPRQGARSYGMVYALSQSDLDRLYGGPGLEAYKPETLTAVVNTTEHVPALCYNLDSEPNADERNQNYAEKLQVVLRTLGFPENYISSIQSL